MEFEIRIIIRIRIRIRIISIPCLYRGQGPGRARRARKTVLHHMLISFDVAPSPAQHHALPLPLLSLSTSLLFSILLFSSLFPPRKPCSSPSTLSGDAFEPFAEVCVSQERKGERFLATWIVFGRRGLQNCVQGIRRWNLVGEGRRWIFVEIGWWRIDERFEWLSCALAVCSLYPGFEVLWFCKLLDV